jgi:sec-independent protein translocase protein TatB
MFDIGFSEVLVIFVLALVVLGPEKLPKVAAQVGRWIGRARGMARQFREQLEEEVNLEEVRRAQTTQTPPPPVVPDPAMHPAAMSPVSSAPASSDSSAQHATSTSAAASEPEQPSYRDGYSHAHPTDDLGRPVPESQSGAESGQQDWVGGVAGTEKPAQSAAPAGYAPPHERGT